MQSRMVRKVSYIEAYSASEAHVHKVPKKQKMKP